MDKGRQIANEYFGIEEAEKKAWDAGYRQGVIRAVKLTMQIYKDDQLRGMTSKGFLLNFAYHLAEMGPEWERYAKILTDCTIDVV